MGKDQADNDLDKLNCEEIIQYMIDERNASNEYAKKGLREMSADEKDHYELLKTELIKKKCPFIPKFEVD